VERLKVKALSSNPSTAKQKQSKQRTKNLKRINKVRVTPSLLVFGYLED
jgi:hypothetical protein